MKWVILVRRQPVVSAVACCHPSGIRQLGHRKADRFSSLLGAEVIVFTFAPVLVMFCKGIKRLGADTVHMPVGMDEVRPFLVAIGVRRESSSKSLIRIGFTALTKMLAWESHVATGS